MTRAVVVSMAAHAAVISSFILGLRPGESGPPARVYTVVDLVDAPAGPRGGRPGVRSTPPQTAKAREGAKPSVKSGVQVRKAPSTERTAPRGTKKGVSGSKGAQEPAPAGGLGIGAGGGGMRVEGEPFPFPEYLRDLVERIEQQWQKPLAAGNQPLLATVQFGILRDGTIVGARVEVSSGRVPFDRAALDAVVRAGPLPALPDGYTGVRLGVHLDFTE
ncbi:MAG: energy transducer TonB [Candidatus Latescibacterota bacterium]